MPPRCPESLPATAICALAAVLLIGSPAAAQDEERPDFPEDGPTLLVCVDDADSFAERNAEVDYNRRIANERLFEDCLADGHRSLAAAVAEAEEPGTRIRILPGRYTVDATVEIAGADTLLIEGLGDGPEDVQLAAGYRAGAVIEATGSADLHLRGFTVLQSAQDGLVVTESDGVVIDRVAATRNGRDGIRLADSSEVLLSGCRTALNDGAGVAIADTDARMSECESHRNTVGLADTGGGASTLSSNRFHTNATGLLVADTGEGHRLELLGNAFYDNNAEPHGNRPDCRAPLSERDWETVAPCPGRTAPGGVGLVLSKAHDTVVSGNRIWGHDTAGALVWGDYSHTGADSSSNRFEGNVLGVRDDGQRDRNRLDLWWDGQGPGNCFDEPGAFHTSPALLPRCDTGNAPDRLLADPVKTYKIWQCGGPEPSDTTGCDWYGAEPTDRLEVRLAVVFAASLLFLTGAGWMGSARSPNPPPPTSMTFSAIATVMAAVLMVLAAWSGRADYEAVAIGLWGAGWLLAGRAWFSAGLHAFGGLTCLVGGIAVLDAIDRGLWTVPVMPFGPAWMWLILLPPWVLLALGAVVRRRRAEPARPAVERTPVTVPRDDRFDW